jgi:hypothetical protein
LKVLPDNTILVTGETIIGGTYAYFLVRYKFNGQLDLDFGNNGVRYISYLTTVSVVRIWTLPDASLLMLGVCRDSQYKFHSGLIKLKPDGVIDSTFAVNGIGFLSHNNLNSGPNRGALQPDGKVVVFGGSTNGIGFLGRFNADGSPDLTFGANGTLSPESTYEIFYDGFVQPDGNIVTVSRYQSPKTQLCSILRYLGSHSVGALETPASLGAALIFPNPVSGGVFQVAFELPEAAPVQIELLDLQGRLLGRLLSANRPSGLCEETLVLPAGIAPGYYLVNIQSSRGNRVVRIAVP